MRVGTESFTAIWSEREVFQATVCTALSLTNSLGSSSREAGNAGGNEKRKTLHFSTLDSNKSEIDSIQHIPL